MRMQLEQRRRLAQLQQLHLKSAEQDQGHRQHQTGDGGAPRVVGDQRRVSTMAVGAERLPMPRLSDGDEDSREVLSNAAYPFGTFPEWDLDLVDVSVELAPTHRLAAASSVESRSEYNPDATAEGGGPTLRLSSVPPLVTPAHSVWHDAGQDPPSTASTASDFRKVGADLAGNEPPRDTVQSHPRANSLLDSSDTEDDSSEDSSSVSSGLAASPPQHDSFACSLARPTWSQVVGPFDVGTTADIRFGRPAHATAFPSHIGKTHDSTAGGAVAFPEWGDVWI